MGLPVCVAHLKETWDQLSQLNPPDECSLLQEIIPKGVDLVYVKPVLFPDRYRGYKA